MPVSKTFIQKHVIRVQLLSSHTALLVSIQLHIPCVIHEADFKKVLVQSGSGMNLNNLTKCLHSYARERIEASGSLRCVW